MKKFVSLVTTACLVFVASLPIQAQETTEAKNITSGQTVYGSPSHGEWEKYEVVVSQEGDMNMNIKTDSTVDIMLEDNNGKIISPYQYEKNNKEDNTTYINKTNNGWRVEGTGNAVYHVESGRYIINLCKYGNGSCSAVMTVTTPKSIDVKVNGQSITFDQAPIIDNGRTLVPVRAIFEALGASVEWYSETGTVVSKKGKTTVKMTIGSSTMQKDGKDITLDVPAQLINDRTLAPVRAIAEAFGCNVDWNGNTQTVTIKD